MEQNPSWRADCCSASHIPAVYGTDRFITVFTRSHHQFQSTPSHPI